MATFDDPMPPSDVFSEEYQPEPLDTSTSQLTQISRRASAMRAEAHKATNAEKDFFKNDVSKFYDTVFGEGAAKMEQDFHNTGMDRLGQHLDGLRKKSEEQKGAVSSFFSGAGPTDQAKKAGDQYQQFADTYSQLKYKHENIRKQKELYTRIADQANADETNARTQYFGMPDEMRQQLDAEERAKKLFESGVQRYEVGRAVKAATADQRQADAMQAQTNRALASGKMPGAGRGRNRKSQTMDSPFGDAFQWEDPKMGLDGKITNPEAVNPNRTITPTRGLDGKITNLAEIERQANRQVSFNEGQLPISPDRLAASVGEKPSKAGLIFSYPAVRNPQLAQAMDEQRKQGMIFSKNGRYDDLPLGLSQDELNVMRLVRQNPEAVSQMADGAMVRRAKDATHFFEILRAATKSQQDALIAAGDGNKEAEQKHLSTAGNLEKALQARVQTMPPEHALEFGDRLKTPNQLELANSAIPPADGEKPGLIQGAFNTVRRAYLNQQLVDPLIRESATSDPAQLKKISEEVANIQKEIHSIPEGEEPKGFAGKAVNFIANFMGDMIGGFLPQVAKFGAASIPAGAAIGAGVGSVVPGPGTVAGAAAGAQIGLDTAMGLATLAQGYTGRLLKGLQEIGVDTTNPQMLAAALEDQDVMGHLREKALKGSAPEAVIAAFMRGIGGKVYGAVGGRLAQTVETPSGMIFRQLSKKGVVANVAATTAADAAAFGGANITGQLWSRDPGESINWEEAGMAGASAIVPAGLGAGFKLLTGRVQPRYFGTENNVAPGETVGPRYTPIEGPSIDGPGKPMTDRQVFDATVKPGEQYHMDFGDTGRPSDTPEVQMENPKVIVANNDIATTGVGSTGTFDFGNRRYSYETHATHTTLGQSILNKFNVADDANLARYLGDFFGRISKAAPKEFADMKVVYTDTPPGAGGHARPGVFDATNNILYLNTRLKSNHSAAIADVITHESGHFAERYVIGEKFSEAQYNRLTEDQKRQAFAQYANSSVTKRGEMASMDATPEINSRFDQLNATPEGRRELRSEWFSYQFSRVVRGETEGMNAGLVGKLKEFLQFMRQAVQRYIGDKSLTTKELDARILKSLEYDPRGLAKEMDTNGQQGSFDFQGNASRAGEQGTFGFDGAATPERPGVSTDTNAPRPGDIPGQGEFDFNARPETPPPGPAEQSAAAFGQAFDENQSPQAAAALRERLRAEEAQAAERAANTPAPEPSAAQQSARVFSDAENANRSPEARDALRSRLSAEAEQAMRAGDFEAARNLIELETRLRDRQLGNSESRPGDSAAILGPGRTQMEMDAARDAQGGPSMSPQAQRMADLFGAPPERVLFASANVEEGTKIDFAVRKLRSSDQASANRRMSDAVSREAGPVSVRSVIGDWADGAENSAMVEVSDPNVAEWQLRRAAAVVGRELNQKGVVYFKADPAGESIIYDIAFGDGVNLNKAREVLSDNGVQFRSITEDANGNVRVIVLDGLGGPAGLADNLNRLIAHESVASVEYALGKADLVGSWSTRAEGLKAYHAVLAETEANASARRSDPASARGVQSEILGSPEEPRSVSSVGLDQERAGLSNKDTVTIRDVAEALNFHTRRKLGDAPFTNEDAAVAHGVLNAIVEARHQLTKREASGADWYDTDIARTEKMVKMVYPQLKSKTDVVLFKALMTPTSFGNNPVNNMLAAGRVFDASVARSGAELPWGQIMARQADGKGWTQRADAVDLAYQRLNKLIADKGPNGAAKWLLSKHTVKELREYNPRTAGKMADEKYGAYIFGPKGGPFFLNMNGIREEMTKDMWWGRTFNRWFGTMLKETDLTPEERVYAHENGLIDENGRVEGDDFLQQHPRNNAERERMNRVANIAAKSLGLTIEELQATLWYYEQQLWKGLGAKVESYSFSDGARRLLEKRDLEAPRFRRSNTEAEARRQVAYDAASAVQRGEASPLPVDVPGYGKLKSAELLGTPQGDLLNADSMSADELWSRMDSRIREHIFGPTAKDAIAFTSFANREIAPLDPAKTANVKLPRRTFVDTPELLGGPVEDIATAYANAKVRLSTASALIKSGQDGRWIEATDLMLDPIRRKLQDSWIYVRRTQESIQKNLGRKLDDSMDVYAKQGLYHGKAGEKMTDLEMNHQTPLMDEMRKSGVDLADFEKYLVAKHAEERNRVVLARDATNDKGAGITTAEAARRIALVTADPAKFALYERLAKRVNNVTKQTLDAAYKGGLITEEAYKAQKSRYQNYVPLKDEFDPSSYTSAFKPDLNDDPNAKALGSYGVFRQKNATGRYTEAGNILANVFAQAADTIRKVEENEVRASLLNLVEFTTNHQDPTLRSQAGQLWEVTKPPMMKTVDANNQIRMSVDPSYRTDPSIVPVMVKGEVTLVKLKTPDLIRAFGETDHATMSAGIRWLAAGSRFLAMVNTSLNPEFVLTNAIRDASSAAINVQSLNQKGLNSGSVRPDRVLSAARAIFAATKNRAAKDAEQQAWMDSYKEMSQGGGKIFFMDLKSVADRQREIVKAVSAIDGKSGAKVKAAVKWLGDGMQDLNSVVENATRLAVFRKARESGMTVQQASDVARNITVNFNRKGEWGTAMNAFYLFYNASIQSTVRMFQAAKNPKVQAIMGGIVGASLSAGLMNRMIAGEDEDGRNRYDKISEWDKSHNMIFVNPASDEFSYIKVPMPYGYNVVWALGQKMADFATGDRVKGKSGPELFVEAMKASGELLPVAVNAFNPVGGSATLLGMVTPTMARPAVELTTNRNYADRPIQPEPSPFAKGEQTKAKLYFNSATDTSKAVADTLAELTGYDGVTPGKIDVSPNVLDYVVGQVFGGMGASVLRTVNASQKAVGMGDGTPLDSGQIPFYRRFVGTNADWVDTSTYYDARSKAYTAIEGLKKAQQAHNSDLVATIRKDYAPALRMAPMIEATDNQLAALRRREKAIEADANLSKEDKVSAKEMISKQRKAVLNRVMLRMSESQQIESR